MTDLRYCKECFQKQQIINKLTVENERLKARLRAQERSAREGAFYTSRTVPQAKTIRSTASRPTASRQR